MSLCDEPRPVTKQQTRMALLFVASRCGCNNIRESDRAKRALRLFPGRRREPGSDIPVSHSTSFYTSCSHGLNRRAPLEHCHTHHTMSPSHWPSVRLNTVEDSPSSVHARVAQLTQEDSKGAAVKSKTGKGTGIDTREPHDRDFSQSSASNVKVHTGSTSDC